MVGEYRNPFTDDVVDDGCMFCGAEDGTCAHAPGRILALDSWSTVEVLENYYEDTGVGPLLQYQRGDFIRPDEANRIEPKGAVLKRPVEDKSLEPAEDKVEVFTKEELAAKAKKEATDGAD